MNNRIALARKEMKVKQDDLAEMCGLTKNFISLIENGKREPSDRTIKDICRALNVNEDWLRYGTGEMFVEMSRDEELAEFFGKIQCSDDDSFPKQFMEVLKDLDVDEWEVLAKMAVKLANKIKRD
jgi:transcriptional regulator with XRE-family HTH domain